MSRVPARIARAAIFLLFSSRSLLIPAFPFSSSFLFLTFIEGATGASRTAYKAGPAGAARTAEKALSAGTARTSGRARKV